MMLKLNKLYELVITECKKTPVRPIKRKKVKIKNMPTTKNVDQYCQGKTKPMKTPLTQTKNVK